MILLKRQLVKTPFIKFIVDVNIPSLVATLLQELGHDVVDVKQNFIQAKDIDIIELAKREKGIILTKDKDFLELSKFPKYQVPLILIRIKD